MNKLIIATASFAAISVTFMLGGKVLSWVSPEGALVAMQPSLTWSSADQEIEKGLNAKPALGHFELKNTGGRAVRIIDVESGCGCAKPEVSPMVVEPGGMAKVEVNATQPPTGEREVKFVVNTNSTVTPRIELKLKISRKKNPPFVVQVRGDLVYKQKPSLVGEERVIEVVTAEISPRDKTPIVNVDLPFIAVSSPRVTDRSHSNSNAIERTYSFTVSVASAPPAGEFSGILTVVDPWSGRTAATVNILGEVTPSMRAAPRRLIITKGGSKPAPESEFIVQCDRAGELVASIEGVEDVPRHIIVDETESSEKLHRFRVRLMNEVTSDSDRFSVVVRRRDNLEEKLSVPVLILTEGKDDGSHRP